MRPIRGLVVDEEGPILVIRLESGLQIRLPGKFDKRKHDKVRILYDYSRMRACEILPDELVENDPHREPEPLDKEIHAEERPEGALEQWDEEFEGRGEEDPGIEEIPAGEESPENPPHGVWWWGGSLTDV